MFINMKEHYLKSFRTSMELSRKNSQTTATSTHVHFYVWANIGVLCCWTVGMHKTIKWGHVCSHMSQIKRYRCVLCYVCSNQWLLDSVWIFIQQHVNYKIFSAHWWGSSRRSTSTKQDQAVVGHVTCWTHNSAEINTPNAAFQRRWRVSASYPWPNKAV